MTRRAIVHRISASAPDDVSGIEAAIASQRIDPKGVIAVLAKTEGNGLVNDFSRGHASLALSLLFERHLATDEAARICLVMSGGTEGAMAPHWLVFERAGGDGTEGPSLAIGRATTPPLPFEHLGLLPQVDQVVAAVRAAMRDAGIDDAADVHFVQVKCPLLTARRVAEADRRGAAVATRDTLKSMGLSRAASALGAAVALGEIDRAVLSDTDIGANWSLWSGRASASAGIELINHEIVSWSTRSTWSRCAPRSSASVSIAPGSCRRRNADGSLLCSARPRPATTDSCAVTAIPCWTTPTSPPRATRAPSSVGRLRLLSGTLKSMFPAAPSTRDRTAADRLRSSSIAPHRSCPCGVQDGRMREHDQTRRDALLSRLQGERPPAPIIQRPRRQNGM